MADNLIKQLPEEVKYLLIEAIENKKSILVGGQTGTGKSTVTNQLVSLIPEDMKVMTVTEGAVNTSMLVSQDSLAEALKRPVDVVVLDEIRGSESTVAFEQMKQGSSVIANIYSNELKHTLSHFINNVRNSSDHPVNVWDVFEDVSTHVAYIIHMENIVPDKAPYISQICEVKKDGEEVTIY